MEILLKGQLHAFSAHLGIHGIAKGLVGVLIGFGRHLGGVAQQMGGIGGLVFPHRGGLDDHAGDAKLDHGGKSLGIHILRQHIVVQRHILDGAQLQLIAHGDQTVSLLRRQLLGQVVLLPELVHKGAGRDIRVQRPGGQIFSEIGGPGLPDVIDGVFIGPGPCHRQMMLDLHAQIVAQVQQLHQILIGTGAVEENEIDHDQIVAGAVGGQHRAVAVQDLAAGGIHSGLEGQGVGKLDRLLGLGGLQLIDPQGEQGDQHGDEYHKARDPHSCSSFH